LNAYQEKSSDLAKLLEKADPNKRLEAALKYPKKIFEIFDMANNAVENATRLAAFETAINEGMSDERAGVYAREISTNFEQGGRVGPLLKGLWAFSNAGLIGTERVATALAKHKGVRKAAAGIYAGTVLLSIINRAITPDDPETGINLYDSLPDWKKRNNIIFSLGNGDFITIPVPFVYNVFHVMGVVTEEVLAGSKSFGEAGAGVGMAILDNANFLGGGGDTVSQQVISTVTPTVLDPLVEVNANKNWLGHPIAPTKYNQAKPDAENYGRGASPQMVAVAKALQSATGGEPGKAGWVDVSPEVLDHWVAFLGGGVGKLAARIPTTVRGALAGDVDTSEFPIVRRLLYTEGSTRDGRVRGAFYDAKDEIDRAHYHFSEMRKRGLDVPDDVRRLASLKQTASATLRRSNELRDRADEAADEEAAKSLRQQSRDVLSSFVRRIPSPETEGQK